MILCFPYSHHKKINKAIENADRLIYFQSEPLLRTNRRNFLSCTEAEKMHHILNIWDCTEVWRESRWCTYDVNTAAILTLRAKHFISTRDLNLNASQFSLGFAVHAFLLFCFIFFLRESLIKYIFSLRGNFWKSKWFVDFKKRHPSCRLKKGYKFTLTSLEYENLARTFACKNAFISSFCLLTFWFT